MLVAMGLCLPWKLCGRDILGAKLGFRTKPCGTVSFRMKRHAETIGPLTERRSIECANSTSNIELRIHCRRRGSNPHDLAATGFLVQRVCQFPHAGVRSQNDTRFPRKLNVAALVGCAFLSAFFTSRNEKIR